MRFNLELCEKQNELLWEIVEAIFSVVDRNMDINTHIMIFIGDEHRQSLKYSAYTIGNILYHNNIEFFVACVLVPSSYSKFEVLTGSQNDIYIKLYYILTAMKRYFINYSTA